MMGAMHKMQSLLKQSDMRKVYLYFIRSKMEFGSIEYIVAAPTHLAKLDRVQRAAEKLCGCSFQTLTDRREAAVFSLVCKLLDGECVEPSQKFAPEFKADYEVEVKTRLQHKTESNKSEELKPKQNQHRNFSLNNYKWGWQGQAASIFNRIPADVKARGTKGSWLKIESVGKATLSVFNSFLGLFCVCPGSFL